MSREEAERMAAEIRERLEAGGRPVESVARLPNDLGFQVRCKGGSVSIFDRGTITPQGKDADAIRELLGLGRPESLSAGSAKPSSRDVFVVYGHDDAARTQLEAMLRRWGLNPLILDQLPSEGQTLIEKLEKYAGGNVGFAVVLATPDDEGYPATKTDEKKFRARQNVVLELGLLLYKLGRAKVAIFLKNQTNMERPSDIQGLIYLPFTDNVEEAKVQLAKEMQKQGIEIDLSKL